MTTILFTTVGYNSWVIPADWNNSNNVFEAIGGGGGGVTLPTGGGGGAYARSNNLVCTPGSLVYIFVGAGGVTPPANTNGVSGQNTWINIVTNAAPTNSSLGVCAGAGQGGHGSGVSGPPGNGVVGQFIANGGWGSNSDSASGGGGGGAGGPHGIGANGIVVGGYAQGGAGDAGYGGAGGTYTLNYSSLNNGQNGANNGSGGGGSHDAVGYTYTPPYGHAQSVQAGYGGTGGLYGGGGGSSIGGSTGAQGIAKITYTPNILVPVLPNTAPNCVPSGINTATKAQIYWAYGTWSDPWNNVSSAHYDTNYKELLSLAGDNDTVTYDTQYNSTSPWTFNNESENFFSDYPRVWKSRSNEWVDDGGIRSVWMRHRTLIGDPQTVPDIDPPSGYITAATNLLFMDEQTYGYRLAYNNNFGYFFPGDIVTQQITPTSNVSATVYMMDPNYIYVNNPVGSFLSGYTITNAYNPSVNAFVTASTEMNERFSANVFPGQSRYICKSTLLAPGQTAEDFQSFLTAYRPANTNFKVYGKIISPTDPGNYSDKIWSRMSENTATQSSFSSVTNKEDYVSLNYAFPVSQLLFGNLQSCACQSNSFFVTVPTVSSFAAGNFIYLSSPGQGTFNVRQIVSIPNNSTLALASLPTFSNTANLNVGIIPGLEDATGAFLYDQNSNIVRYVTNNDISFDFFNQFAVKIVPVSDNPVICPTFTEPRFVAAQASS